MLLYESYGCSQYTSKIFARIDSCVSVKSKRILWISEKEIPPQASRKMKMDKFCHLLVSDKIEVRCNFQEQHKNVEKLANGCHSPKEIFSTRNFAYFLGGG